MFSVKFKGKVRAAFGPEKRDLLIEIVDGGSGYKLAQVGSFTVGHEALFTPEGSPLGNLAVEGKGRRGKSMLIATSVRAI